MTAKILHFPERRSCPRPRPMASREHLGIGALLTRLALLLASAAWCWALIVLALSL